MNLSVNVNLFSIEMVRNVVEIINKGQCHTENLSLRIGGIQAGKVFLPRGKTSYILVAAAIKSLIEQNAVICE